MLGLRYFVWNSEKLNYLVIGMVISMMAFASTTLIIDGLSTEINTLTSSVQNDVSEIVVFSENETFTPRQLNQINKIIIEEKINPYGLTRTDLEKKYNETGFLSNVQFIYSKTTFAKIERYNSSRIVQLTITNLTQLFGKNAIRFEINSSALISQGLWMADPSFYVLDGKYNVSITTNQSAGVRNVNIPTTYRESFGSGLIADWSLFWDDFSFAETNKVAFSIIPESLLQGFITLTNLKNVLTRLNEIEGLQVKTNSAVSRYLEISKTDVIKLLRVLLVSIFALIMVSIVNSTYLLIQERKQEFRVLKAIGFTRFAIIKLILSQFLLVSFISSIVSYTASVVIFNLIFATLALAFNNIYIISSAKLDILVELILLSASTSIFGTIIGLIISKKEDPEFL